MRGLLGLYRASKAWTQTSKVSPYIEARIRDSESKSPVCINFANAVTAAALTSPRESLRRALTAAMACGLPLITSKTMTNPYDDDDGSNNDRIWKLEKTILNVWKSDVWDFEKDDFWTFEKANSKHTTKSAQQKGIPDACKKKKWLWIEA